jgi:hypothetical protein
MRDFEVRQEFGGSPGGEMVRDRGGVSVPSALKLSGEPGKPSCPQVHSSDYDTEAVHLEPSVLDAAKLGVGR